MNRILKTLIVAMGFVFISTACEDDEPLDMIIPETPIVFDDDIDKRGGTYLVSGMTNIKVSVADNVTSLNVTSRYTPSGSPAKLYSLGSVPVTGGVGNFSMPSRSLFDPADLQDNAATLATGKIRAIGAFTLIFDAVFPDGTERKFYTATVTNSIAFSAFSTSAPTVNPATFFNDSTYTLKFTLQNPESARVTNVQVFRKLGGAAEEVAPIYDVDYSETTATIVDEYEFDFPDQVAIPAYAGANYSPATAANRTVTHRFVVTTSIGNTNSYTVFNVANTPIAIGVTRSLANWAPNTIWDLSEKFAAASEAEADLKFVTTGTGFDKTLDLTVGAGNGSDFVRMNSLFDYANASYNSIRDAYAAGTPVTTVSDLIVGDNIIINVGDIDDNARPNFKILRVTALTRDAVGSADRVSFDYKSID